MTVGKVVCLSAALCLAVATASPGAERPVTVSPGSAASVEAAALCPTFSWGGVTGAEAYELVVYELKASPSAGSPPAERAALRVNVSGAASSWTPPADRCLAFATPYAWFIRALGAEGATSEWSPGAMFRTPAPPPGLREQILRVVQSYLATPEDTTGPALQEVAPAALDTVPPARSSESPLAGGLTARGPDPVGTPAFRSEHAATSGSITYGVYGISNSSENGSAGVAGYATATSGEVGGVAGFNDSVQGFGVFGMNSGTTGGVGVMGRDEADSGITAGVVGLTDNDEGYGGFFWNEDGGDALVVADPALHPASVDVKMFVDVDGNLGLVGVVELEPTDWPTRTCEAVTEGAIYYDLTDHWLCVCTRTGTGPDTWGYRRADDPTDDCSSPAP